MRTSSISMAVLLFASSLLNAQDNAPAESAASAKTNSQNKTRGTDFVPGLTSKSVVQGRSPTLKPDPEQEKAATFDSLLDGEVRTDERHTMGGAPVDPKEYIIGTLDLLRIAVWREPELSGQFFVRPDGKISLPLINEIQAASLTSEQLAAHIAESLSKYMVQPLVTVAVEEVNSRKYFVLGEVQKPGAFRLVVPTTVLDALGNAGGFREFANTKNILVLRGTQTLKFNYKNVTRGKDMEQNILLQSGDHIIVR